jgi:hypothetical protein
MIVWMWLAMFGEDRSFQNSHVIALSPARRVARSPYRPVALPTQQTHQQFAQYQARLQLGRDQLDIGLKAFFETMNQLRQRESVRFTRGNP